MGNLSDLAKVVGSTAWQLPQTLLGLGAGMAKTRRMPAMSMTGDKASFTFPVEEGQPPQQSGQVLLAPPGMDATSKAHEGVHAEQSERYGPAYLPLNLLGAGLSKLSSGDPDLDHPLEDEAYLRTEPSSGLSNRLAFKAAARKPKPKQKAKGLKLPLRRVR